jgi:nicotinamide-nucleotide amidase
MLKVSLITIGDEIRIGQIINTNAAWLSNELTRLGVFVSNHITIGDDFELMIEVINEQIQHNDCVITTGGLGPTHDDITKPVLLKIFNDELIEDKNTINYLKEFFKIRNRALTERNRQQALVPSKAKLLPNKIGTAPGLLFEKDGKYIISLPGVPSEMKYITTNSILPLMKQKIEEKNENVVLYKTLNVAGIFESNLADLIGNPDTFLGEKSSLAFLPSYQGIKLRIGTIQDNFEFAKKEIERIAKILYDKAGNYIWSEDKENLAEVVGELLLQEKKTLSVAESCTGGWLGREITAVAGSSEYFLGGIISYSNEVKINQLKVSKETIERYGAVSQQTAFEMAKNVREIFSSHYSIAITGIAGPSGGTADKPVGTVWIGLATADNVQTFNYNFGNERSINRERAVGTSLLLLLQAIKNNKKL